MSLLKKLYSILQGGMGPRDGFYANSAVHMWSAAFLMSLCLAHTKPGHWWSPLAVGTVITALKEFWFDMRYEVPPQSYGSVKGPGALNDWVAYMLGFVLGVIAWLI